MAPQTLRHLVQTNLQDIGFENRDPVIAGKLRSQLRSQLRIDFYRHRLGSGCGDPGGHIARPGADLQHDIAGLQPQRVKDTPLHARVRQKHLPQPRALPRCHC